LDFWKCEYLNVCYGSEAECVSVCEILSKSVKQLLRYGDLSYFQDGRRAPLLCPPSWIAYDGWIFGPPTGHEEAFIVLQNLVGMAAVVWVLTRHFEIIWEKPRPQSPLLTRRLCHKVPIVTMGCPTFTPKTVPSHSTITTPCNTPLPRPTRLTTQTASGYNHPFCRSTLAGHTHGIGDKPLRIPAYALLTRLIIRNLVVEEVIVTPLSTMGYTSVASVFR